MKKWKRKKQSRPQSTQKVRNDMKTEHNITADVKRAQDEKFTWIGQQRGSRTRVDRDVTVNLIRGSAEKGFGAVSITFRNDSWSDLGENVEIAIFKNRILFRQGECGFGWKNKGNVKTKNHYMRITLSEETKALKNFVGDYDLKYDSFYELHYIEKESMTI